MRTTTRMTLAAGVAVALGSVPIGAVFEEWAWIWYAWAAIATVVAASLLARSLRLPALLVPVAGALGLLLYLTVVFSSASALAGLVPTPGSLDALWRDIGTGFEDVNALAAPVPATPGLKLLCAVSIGLVAIVVDAIAVGLRRPAAAGLALLALYAVPTAVASDGVPWILFAIGACGYLVMLLVEGRDRLLRWGRPVGSAPPAAAYGARGPAEDDTPPPLTGQRIGAFAIALAVVVPLFVPGLTGDVLSRIGRTGTGDSGTGTGALSEFAALRGQLERGEPVTLMTVRTNLATPEYLRTKVLDRYRDAGFGSSPEESDAPLPGDVPPPRGLSGSAPAEAYTLSVRLEDDYGDDHLPTYLAAQRVEDVDRRWGYDADNGVIRSNERGGDFTYEVTGAVPRPTARALEDAGPLTDEDRTTAGRFTLPSTGRQLPLLLRQTVEQVTRGQTSDFGKARAIQDYFLDPKNAFSYALRTVEGNSGDALVDFLTKKQGYCEQYAAAMALMLRQEGIPSRVAIGYTAGTKQDDGSWTVTTNDAHAWVEAFIHDYGWVKFDPTPLAGGRGIAPPYAPAPTAAPSPSSSLATASAGPTARTDGGQLEEDPSGTSGLDGSGDDGLLTPQRVGLGAGGLAVVLALLAPAVVRLSTRRRRLRAAGGSSAPDAARAAWDEVVGSAADYGVPVAVTETPRGLARRLGHDLSLDASATAGLRLVALAEERARYAPRAGVDGDLPTAVKAVRRGLRAHADTRRRWQAVLLPTSTVRAARTGSAARSATASQALSRLGESVRRPVTPRRR